MSRDSFSKLGETWTSIAHFTLGRNGEEAHPLSTCELSKLITELNLVDIWREKDENVYIYNTCGFK